MNFHIFCRYFFQSSLWKFISFPVLMLESLFFSAVLTTYQRWFPKNFVKIGLICTDLEIGFEKFGKNKNFLKSQKNLSEWPK
jgi:hypothetical protein